MNIICAYLRDITAFTQRSNVKNCSCHLLAVQIPDAYFFKLRVIVISVYVHEESLGPCIVPRALAL